MATARQYFSDPPTQVQSFSVTLPSFRSGVLHTTFSTAKPTLQPKSFQSTGTIVAGDNPEDDAALSRFATDLPVLPHGRVQQGRVG